MKQSEFSPQLFTLTHTIKYRHNFQAFNVLWNVTLDWIIQHNTSTNLLMCATDVVTHTPLVSDNVNRQFTTTEHDRTVINHLVITATACYCALAADVQKLQHHTDVGLSLSCSQWKWNQSIQLSHCAHCTTSSFAELMQWRDAHLLECIISWTRVNMMSR